MTDYDPGPVLGALADPTRRALLADVIDLGPVTATQLADGRDISRQAIAKHLTVLGSAGLVHGDRAGREVHFRADTAPLATAAAWMQRTGDAWDRRLDALRHVTSQD